MRLFVVASTLLVVTAGCGDDEGPAAGAGRHPEPAAALARCRAGIEGLGGLPPGERAVGLGRACAALYVEPGCRDAMRNLGALPPERRAATLARACRDAYCPHLAEPQPALCAADFGTLRPTELGPLWAELGQAALERDLGAEHAAEARRVLDAAAGLSMPIVRTGPEPAGDATVLMVAVRRDEAGTYHLYVDHHDGTTSSHELASLDAHAVASVLPPLDGTRPEPRVSLAADRALPYEDVVTLMDALRGAGYGRLSLAVAPAGP